MALSATVDVAPGAASAAPARAPILLDVNGIEVIYNHVILVLKGVSLQVPEGRIVALMQPARRRDDTLIERTPAHRVGCA